MSNVEQYLAAILKSVQDEAKAASDARAATEERLTTVIAAVTALQVTAAAPKKTKSGTATSTPAGVNATTGQPVAKFANNTSIWLKEKAAADPNFLPSRLTPANYQAMETRHAAELEKLSDVEKRRKMAGIVWTYLNQLADNSSEPESKTFASNLLVHLRNQWKTEKTEYLKNNVDTVTAGVGGLVLTNGVLVPDTPVVTEHLSGVTLVQPTTHLPLINSFSLTMP